MAYIIAIFNGKSMKQEKKSFKTRQQADAWFDSKKQRTNGRSPQNLPTAFSYTNEWGTIMSVAKKY